MKLMALLRLAALSPVACAANASSTVGRDVEPSALDASLPGPIEVVTTDAGSAGDCSSYASHASATEAGSQRKPRPTGSVVRFNVAYQGPRVRIVGATGLDMISEPSSAPLTAGTNSGYWFELQDAKGKVLFTRLVRDPSVIEGPPPPGGGAFVNAKRPWCDEKTMTFLVPNDANARSIVFFASDYGTQKPAVERARFGL